MLVGFLGWGETLNAWMLAGAAVVAASGIYKIRLVAPRG
jgi:drug/metabolite transporter (DMT)-like permease